MQKITEFEEIQGLANGYSCPTRGIQEGVVSSKVFLSDPFIVCFKIGGKKLFMGKGSTPQSNISF